MGLFYDPASNLDPKRDERLRAAAARVEIRPAERAAWLGMRLGIPVQRGESGGPGITEVSFETAEGKVALSRPDGRNATLAWPGRPERRVALHRRDTAELVAEELRRLEPDEVYAETLRALAAGVGSPAQ